MKLHVGGEFELVSWILSFGPSAHVVGPDHLRQRVQDELTRALDSYSSDGKEVTVAPHKKNRKVEPRKAAARH